VGCPHHLLDNQQTDFSSLVPQRYSWDRLTISENGIRLLLNKLQAFPAFVDVICAFGKVTSETSDSLGGCYSWKQGNVSGQSLAILNMTTG